MEMFNLFKFISGFNIFDGSKLGKLLFYAILIVISLTVYHKIFEPKSITRVERIENQIINQCPEETKFFGVKFNLWKIKLSGGV